MHFFTSLFRFMWEQIHLGTSFRKTPGELRQDRLGLTWSESVEIPLKTTPERSRILLPISINQRLYLRYFFYQGFIHYLHGKNNLKR